MIFLRLLFSVICGNATEENTSPSTLRMEAELNAETLVTRYQSTLPCHISGDRNVEPVIIAMIKANLVILFHIEDDGIPQ
jgi:hypothetical protein